MAAVLTGDSLIKNHFWESKKMPAQPGLAFGPEALIIPVSLYLLHPC